MQTLFAFLAAILLLVSLHEFGHYIVARLCGVKVVRFSIGFGKPFFIRKRGETEWCLAPIPLGGYVKMTDTREGEVAEADLPRAFDRQHPAKRIAIVAAGPLTNLALAVLLYGLSFSLGVTEIRPYVGTVDPSGIAAQAGFQAGDRIVSINGKQVEKWDDAQVELLMNLEAGKINVAVETAEGRREQRIIEAETGSDAGKIAKNQGNFGLSPFKMSDRIAVVEKNSPAVRAGLQVGDRLLSADGKTLASWAQWVEMWRTSAGRKVDLVFERDGKRMQTFVRPDSVELSDGTLIGKVGIGAQADEAWMRKVSRRFHPSLPQAFGMAWHQTVAYSLDTVRFFGKMLTGQASVKHISGPLTIADAAGKTAALGLQSYLAFLALVSISLGVLNLMPVPVLDGGHLVLYAFEWIRGKPLSERIQAVGLRMGMLAVLMLMLVAFFNDINRLFG